MLLLFSISIGKEEDELEMKNIHSSLKSWDETEQDMMRYQNDDYKADRRVDVEEEFSNWERVERQFM